MICVRQETGTYKTGTGFSIRACFSSTTLNFLGDPYCLFLRKLGKIPDSEFQERHWRWTTKHKCLFEIKCVLHGKKEGFFHQQCTIASLALSKKMVTWNEIRKGSPKVSGDFCLNQKARYNSYSIKIMFFTVDVRVF